MTRLCCTAQFVAAVVLAAGLTGCGTVELFGKYQLQESPETAEAPWPRLIDTPEAPPTGSYSAAVPDPAQGAEVLDNLTTDALVADIRRQDLTRPVIPADELDVLLQNAGEARALVEERRKAEDQARPRGAASN